MPRYEWRGVDVYHDRQGQRTIEPGDVVEIDAHLADPHPEFVPVADATEADADTDTEPDTESAVGEWDDEEWLDGGYQDRADMVRTGSVDEYLDEIEACETSQTVRDAVAARREELAGEG